MTWPRIIQVVIQIEIAELIAFKMVWSEYCPELLPPGGP